MDRTIDASSSVFKLLVFVLRRRRIVHEILLLCESLELQYGPGISIFAHFDSESGLNRLGRLHLIRLTAEFHSMANINVEELFPDRDSDCAWPHKASHNCEFANSS